MLCLLFRCFCVSRSHFSLSLSPPCEGSVHFPPASNGSSWPPVPPSCSQFSNMSRSAYFDFTAYGGFVAGFLSDYNLQHSRSHVDLIVDVARSRATFEFSTLQLALPYQFADASPVTVSLFCCWLVHVTLIHTT